MESHCSTLATNTTCLASHPEYPKFAHLLSSGWISGRLVDNSDQQYASFRDNVPYLIVVMTLHPLLRRLFDSLLPTSTRASRRISKPSADNYNQNIGLQHTKADSRLEQRVTFDVGFSLLFLLALHGFSAMKVLTILYINYNIATRLRKGYVPIVTWVFSIGILFANELGRGYPFTDIASWIQPWSASSSEHAEQISNTNWATALDSYGGLIPRWEILFNVTVLRLISFNFDYYWSFNRAGGSPIEVCNYRSATIELTGNC